MPSTRRSILRAVSLGAAASVAGCTGRERPGSTTETTTPRTTAADRTTSDQPARSFDYGRAFEFAHRSPVLESGVGDAETGYYARLFSNEREAAELDVSGVGDVAGQDPAAVSRFVAETDFREIALFAIQARVESVGNGLEFDFVDGAATPPQVVGHLESSDREGGDRAISTLLVRVPARHASNSLVTLVDRVHPCTESICETLTFEPPNEPVYETVTAEDLTNPPNEKLGVPSGALVTTPDAAEGFVPTDAPFAEFVRATDYDALYLCAVQMRLGANGYRLWPTGVRADGSDASIELRRGFGGGVNAAFTNLTLARIPGEALDRGTATVRKYDGHDEPAGKRTVSLSSDPADW